MRWIIAAILLVLFIAPTQAQTNIFIITPSGNNAGNAGLEFIQEVPLTGNTLGQISVRFASGTVTGLTVTNAYICMAASAGSTNCSDSPVQLKCSASATCATGGANATIDTDYSTYSTTGTDFLICFDIAGPGNDDMTNNTSVTNANANFNNVSGRCSSSNRSTGWSQVSGTVGGVSQVNTKASGGSTVHSLSLMGEGQ